MIRHATKLDLYDEVMESLLEVSRLVDQTRAEIAKVRHQAQRMMEANGDDT